MRDTRLMLVELSVVEQRYQAVLAVDLPPAQIHLNLMVGG